MLVINNISFSEAVKLAASNPALEFDWVAETETQSCAANVKAEPETWAKFPVIVCTDKRGVFFGYCTNADARRIELTDARMCLYWSSDVGGVLGLGDIGPTKGCRISATATAITLEGVTAVYAVSSQAEEAWKNAPVQGRQS